MNDAAIIPSPIDPKNPISARPVLQWVIPVDLNNDGRDDFIIQYWQQATPGEALTNATVDAVYALVSRPDGTYTVDNIFMAFG